MKNEFIPFQQALELKELGFDEPCFGKIYADGGSEQLSYPYKNSDQIGKVTSCSAPLYQQVFRWFREKYNLRGFIGFRPNVKKFDCHVYDMSLSGKEYVKQRTHEEFQKDPKVGTYEEAELECIKELISIVKNNETN
jgi:hypothetical protein